MYNKTIKHFKNTKPIEGILNNNAIEIVFKYVKKVYGVISDKTKKWKTNRKRVENGGERKGNGGKKEKYNIYL